MIVNLSCRQLTLGNQTHNHTLPTTQVCRTRLELFEYTDTRRTLSLPLQQRQCVNLVNTMDGGFCNVNGVLFGNNATGNAGGWVPRVA